MASTVLYWTYLVVMGASLVCFFRALALRHQTPRHRRWGIAGVALAIGGIVVVVVAYRVFGWVVDQRYPSVVDWHRRVAYAATALVVLVGVSGARRWPIHKQLYKVFLPLYVLALALAAVGYQP